MRHTWLLPMGVLLGSLIPGVACSLPLSGSSPSAADASEAVAPDTGLPDTGLPETSTPDSSSDAPPPKCPGLTCNGACITASDCRSCSGAPLLCASTKECAPTCQGCNDTTGVAMPIECFACDSNHANPIGSCQYDDAGSYCLSGDYAGQYPGGTGYQCSCTDGGVSSCPGATQVCVPLGNVGQSFCLTCGEATVGTIQGALCQGGGACRESQAVCQ